MSIDKKKRESKDEIPQDYQQLILEISIPLGFIGQSINDFRQLVSNYQYQY